MQRIEGVIQFSAGDLIGHLACRHLTKLDAAVARGELEAPKVFDPFIQILWERGAAHERAYIDHLEQAGLDVARVDGDGAGAMPVEQTVDAMRAGRQIIVQGALAHGQWSGRTDILKRIETPSALGAWSYEVIDTKLARETKGGTILQLSLYSDLVAGVQERVPEQMAVVPPWSEFQSQVFRTNEFAAYYRLVRQSLEASLAGAGGETYPDPKPHCEICRWREECDARRRADDHVSLVAWLTAIVPNEGTWLDQTRAARWAPRTRDEAMKSYGLYLKWLRDHGRLDPAGPPAHRVAPELVCSFITDEIGRLRTGTLSNVLFHLIGIVTSLAPEDDWDWLYRLRSRLKRRASRAPRTRPSIVPAQSLFDLGIALMRRATESRAENNIDIDSFLDGLLLALLISVYLRIGNFSQLELGRDLERCADRWRLGIAGDMTKTGQADNSLLPITLTAWIDLYVNVVRPRLIGGSRVPDALANRVWVGLDARPLSGHLIRERIKARTKQAFGFAICPHTFRKIAATTFILERPEYALHGPALLGHRSEETIQKHYFASQQQLALRTYRYLRDSGRVNDTSRTTGPSIIDRRIKALLVCAASPPSGRQSRRKRRRDVRPLMRSSQ